MWLLYCHSAEIGHEAIGYQVHIEGIESISILLMHLVKLYTQIICWTLRLLAAFSNSMKVDFIQERYNIQALSFCHRGILPSRSLNIYCELEWGCNTPYFNILNKIF
jgi:hypothetical protein